MSSERFDEFTKELANGTTRGAFLKRLLVGAGTVAVGGTVGGAVAPSASAAPCANQGQSCNAQKCCSGLVCIGTPGSRVCCPKNQACGSQSCCAPCQRCANGACVADLSKNGTACSPNPCIVGATCMNGVCQGGSLKNCADNNPCTQDFCDPATGFCGHTALPNGPEHAGDCPQPANECQFATCNNGLCGFANKVDGTECDDGNLCTVDDRCQAGVCSGAPKNCPDDDNIRCSSVTCDPATGECVRFFEPNCCTTDADCGGPDNCQRCFQSEEPPAFSLCVSNCDPLTQVCNGAGECICPPEGCPPPGGCCFGRICCDGCCDEDSFFCLPGTTTLHCGSHGDTCQECDTLEGEICGGSPRRCCREIGGFCTGHGQCCSGCCNIKSGQVAGQCFPSAFCPSGA